MLKTKIAQEIKADEDLENCTPVFESLGRYANEKVEQYRIELVEDLKRLCREAGLEIQVDFPKFTVLKGINGEIDFGARCTRINKKVLKSIDPRRILTAVSRLKHQLTKASRPLTGINHHICVFAGPMDRANPTA